MNTTPQLFIGTGGWQYFIIPGRDPLREYSRIFNFVEVNVTFYREVSIDEVANWRRRVPDNFIFSVRAPKIVTHDYMLKPVKPVINAMDYISEVADILNSNVIVLETPSKLAISKKLLKEFVESIDLNDKYLAVEPRGAISKEAIEYMKNKDMIYISDLSKEEPPYYNSEIGYSRIFGPGKHNRYQFTRKELKRIHRRATNAPVKMILMCFHGIRMYADAGRLRYLDLYGDFPKNKPPYGLDAVREELSRDMKFPATRDEIIQHEGWKVIPLNEKDDIHIGDILSWLPPKIYYSVDEVINELKKLKIFRDLAGGS